MTTENAAGQIYPTVDDLCHWHQALVGGKVVTRKTFDAMIQAGVLLPVNPPPFISRYAYGFITGEYQGQPLYFQAGGVSGFLSLMFYFPADKTTLIVLSNLASFDFLQAVSDQFTFTSYEEYGQVLEIVVSGGWVTFDLS